MMATPAPSPSASPNTSPGSRPRPRPRAATYRVQLHAGFTFDDAAAITGYLAELGVSHLYCSPVLQAAAGSTHGYDVVDHGRLNATARLSSSSDPARDAALPSSPPRVRGEIGASCS